MIEVVHPGFYTTVQDGGRFDYQEYGVPISGAMDHYAMQLANQILGNSANDAVIECTMIGPKLKFHANTHIAITGANMSATLNNELVELNTVIAITKNDILHLNRAELGFRSYIAVHGGLLYPDVLESKSMLKHVTPTAVITKNAVIQIPQYQDKTYQTLASVKVNPLHFKNNELQAYKGPEYHLLNSNQKERLTDSFTISNNNDRMAYQLEEPVKNQLASIITSLVLPGTVQLTPAGQLIILMRDCQTTGGYPRILQLTDNAINILAQKHTGQKLHFKTID